MVMAMELVRTACMACITIIISTPTIIPIIIMDTAPRPVDTEPTIIIHTCIHHIIPIHIYTAQEQIAIMAVAAGMASSGEESKSIQQ